MTEKLSGWRDIDAIPQRHEIAPGTYILSTAGTAPDGDAMRRQADYSSRLVKSWFESGKLRIISSKEEGEVVD